MSLVPNAKLSATAKQTGQALINFIDKAPSAFHAVYETVQSLKAHGFSQLREDENWDDAIQPNGKYYVTRNQSAVVAFAVGGNYAKGNGFHIVGAHSDSPCLKIKPVSKVESQGSLQVGVETYGGGLWNTWFDRDLGVAGRVFVKDAETSQIAGRLVLINRPIMRIPMLAIHLQDAETRKAFSFNNENHLRPVLATSVMAELTRPKTDADAGAKHHPILLDLLAKELDVTVDQIFDFELSLFDTQGGAIGGLLEEYVFAPRLDNLCCTWLATQSLLKSLPTLETESNVRVAASFDNEEVGSNSLMGAGSNFLQSIITRVSGGSLTGEVARKSMLISADMAHGVHPNYSEKHEVNSRIQMHSGPVIKYNANERYATSGETALLIKELGRRHGLDIQDFVSRQDCGCGSTIGPILATSTGIRTVDMGLAQFSMHSIREQCGTVDLELAIELFSAFYNDFVEIDGSIATDSLLG
ncbi:aspartyl aminopeptidase [Saprolegnia diclina VS20]|uniref:aspartyl aminopeptidase n=1 Tax=Saprolegnia diclina (strain VS20) TaxID=1156394 RepID=T0PM91_SAPDV|nr:aspartyl aminopeptidase [Saprolegnia diclina VS20]EQC26479.1 aspartyl aminopeptidase [Saprolegnia diclina VS20]|eukprot:XP_008620058.1 aspartyl aminopeptidase [Saprolegnia diclina VS20]